MHFISLSGNQVLKTIPTPATRWMYEPAVALSRAAPVMTRSRSPLLLIRRVCGRPPRSPRLTELCFSFCADHNGFISTRLQRENIPQRPAFIGFRFLPFFSGDKPGERGRERAVMGRYSVLSLDYISEE